MDLLLALNVTIYGLGIVFLALLVLMFCIMVMSKIFSMATGKEVFSAIPAEQAMPALAFATADVGSAVATPEARVDVKPEQAVAPAPVSVRPSADVLEQVFAPLPGKVLSVAVKAGDRVKKGAELCVIEAMKMGNSIKAQQDGVVSEVLVAAGDSVAFGAAMFTIVGDGSIGQVVKPSVMVPPTRPQSSTAPASAAPSAFFEIGAGETQHELELRRAADGSEVVAVDGTDFDVVRDRADISKLVVNGSPHTVVIERMEGDTATVVVDGVAHQLVVSGLPQASPAIKAPAPQPAPAAAKQSAPAPASPSAGAVPATPAGGETITAPLPGKILSVGVKLGDQVSKGDELCVIEAMKMGNSIKAQRAGTIAQLHVSPGQSVGFGAPLMVIR